jgi:ATP-binding cassette subfamily C protein CydD/ATP-binding cassette subfamily C protein CydCD
LPVLALGAIGVFQGLATIALTFAVTTLVVAVVQGRPVLAAGVWLVGLFIVRALLAAATELVGTWAGLQVSTVLRERLIGVWLTRDADSRPEAGRAQALATQGMTSIEPYVARYLPALVSGAFLPLLAIGTLAFVDWPSALIVAFTVPLLPVFAALIGRTTQESTQRRWRSLSALSGHFLDVMRGLPTLASYGRADAQVESIAAVSGRHRLATMKTLRLAFMSSAALELLATISVALVAVTVGLRLAYGTMPLATAMLAILLAPEAFWPIRRVGTEFHSAADGAEALGNVLAEIDPAIPQKDVAGAEVSAPSKDTEVATGKLPTTQPPTTQPPTTQPPTTPSPTTPSPTTQPPTTQPPTIQLPSSQLLTPQLAPARLPGSQSPTEMPGEPSRVVADGIGYGFPGSKSRVLNDVSFSLTAGLTVVTGVSGVGKSTLLELMAGLRAPGIGTLTAPRSHLVSQRPFLAPGTVRDNLTLGNDSSDEQLWQILRVVGLDYMVVTLAHGLDTRLGDDGFGLSAGQRARLTLARAALSTAPLVLLDEPTAHLDEESAALAHQLIQKLAEQRIVVAVTHRPELLTLADEHIHLALQSAGDLVAVLS